MFMAPCMQLCLWERGERGEGKGERERKRGRETNAPAYGNTCRTHGHTYTHTRVHHRLAVPLGLSFFHLFRSTTCSMSASLARAYIHQTRSEHQRNNRLDLWHT